MPAALVTGSTGLVGSYLVERLLEDGWQVRALVRTPQQASWLAARGAVLCAGDVLHPSTIAESTRGADVVFHAAAAVVPRGGWDAYRLPNVEGTRHVIEAASRAAARIVHVSSVAVYGGHARYRSDGDFTDEDTPLAPLADDAWYPRSKRDAEALVMRAQAEGRIWATAIRPCVIYGRRDRYFTARAGRVLSRGFVPLLRGGRSTMAIVHAANVADACVRAAAADIANGRAYNAANDHRVSVREFLDYAAEGLGTRIRALPVPLAVARTAAAVATIAGRAMGRGSSFTARTALDFLSRDNPFTSARARQELGWSPGVQPAEGIVDAFRWWRENNKGATR